MNTKLFTIVLSVLITIAVVTSGCCCAADPNAVEEAVEGLVKKPTVEAEVELTDTPDTEDTPTASYAGGEAVFAVEVEEFDDGWSRIIKAANGEGCAWAFQYKLELGEGLVAVMHQCIELRVSGEGSFTFEVKPDDAGYGDADTAGDAGLAWWPSGTGGRYRVDDGEWTELTTVSAGIDFPSDGEALTIEVELDEGGYITIPLGEIRENIQPAQ